MRETLPLRRRCENIKFKVGNQTYQASIGFYDDGRVGEIFINCNKAGTDINVNMRDAAILASFALQHGATLLELKSSLSRNENGSPEGPLGILMDLLVPLYSVGSNAVERNDVHSRSPDDKG